MAEGEFALVREYSEAALTRPSMGWITVGDHDLYSLLADAATMQRDEVAIQRYAPLAEEFALRYNHKLYLAVAHRAWGARCRLVGQYAESRQRLDQALEIFQQMNTRYQIGRTLFEFGELASMQPETERARDYFTRAMETFKDMQAAPDVQRAKAALGKLA